MINSEQLQIIAQLLDNMEIVANKIEKAYNDKDSETFSKAKKEIFDIQTKISRMVG